MPIYRPCNQLRPIGTPTTPALTPAPTPDYMQSQYFAAKSSTIISVSWEPGDELRVAFKNNSIYLYENVPYDVYVSLSEAKSTGKAFSQLVRDKFECQRIY